MWEDGRCWRGRWCWQHDSVNVPKAATLAVVKPVNVTSCVFCHNKKIETALEVWLSGLSASMRTKGSPVRFPVRAYA